MGSVRKAKGIHIAGNTGVECTEATRCTPYMLRNAHRVIGSATKSATACPCHNPGNAVPLQLSDNSIRPVSGPL